MDSWIVPTRVALLASTLAVLAACGGGEVPDAHADAHADAPDAATRAAPAPSAAGDGDAGGADAAPDNTPQARHRRGDRSCARLVTRTRSVASVGGGPMQMVMVTECVPAAR